MRDERQRAVTEWALDTFGPVAGETRERVIRLVEEVFELAQAEGVELEALVRVGRHVYAKPAGDPGLEVGAVGVTLLAYCGVRGFSAEQAECAEAERVMALPREHFRARQNAKAEAGVAGESR